MKNKNSLILLIILGLFLFINSASKAAGKSWDFEKWQVDIEINEDGTFLVKEKQTFNFQGNFHWVQRDILKQRLRKITEVAVFNESGRELSGKEIEIREDEEHVSIKLNFDLTDIQKAWTFQYRVHGGLGFFTEYDEIYWNAISSEREVPIKEVAVSVFLPEEVQEKEIRQKLFVGFFGSERQSFNYQVVNEDTLSFWGEDIAPYENLTIVASFPKRIVQNPGAIKVISNPLSGEVLIDGRKTGFKTPVILEQGYDIPLGSHTISVESFGWKMKEERSVLVEQGKVEEIEIVLEKTLWLKVLAFLPFLIPLGLIAFILKRQQKYSKVKKTIIAQYEPPDNLPPLEIGALVDAQVQPRDITAVIIDLAYRGYIKIKEEMSKGIFGVKRKYTLIKTEKFSLKNNDLKDYEESLCSAFFNSKDEVQIDDLRRRTSLARDLQKIKEKVFKKLVNNNYLTTAPDKDKLFYLGIFILIVIIGVAFLILFNFIFKYIYLAQSLILSSVIAFISLIFSPIPLSEKGAEAKWHALGFKDYLQVAERFRLGACTPETFEKYLSYALVFKIEEKWANRFVEIYKKAPSWFVSSQPMPYFSVSNFTNNISSLSNSVSAAVVSGTASSGSGFGGGGSAGGGGGGGGSSAG